MIIHFPSAGRIRIHSMELFRNRKGEEMDSLLEKLFSAPEVDAVEIDMQRGCAEIVCGDCEGDARKTLGKIEQFLHPEPLSCDPVACDHAENRHASSPFSFCRRVCQREEGRTLRILRYGDVFSTWEIKHELRGRIRLRHTALFGKRDLCRAIEDAVSPMPGVDSFSWNAMACTVVIYYDPHQIGKSDLLSILDSVLEKAGRSEPSVQVVRDTKSAFAGSVAGAVSKVLSLVRRAGQSMNFVPAPPLAHLGPSGSADGSLVVGSTSVALAVVGQYAIPALLPVSGALLLYGALPSFKGAWRLAVKERRLGVEILNVLVISCCLATGEFFAAAFMGMSLILGRKVLRKTQDDSRKMLLGAFCTLGPSLAIVRSQGTEREIPIADVAQQDIVVVRAGEIVPVDGIIAEGFGVIDSHILTGETTPVERGVGDRVYGSTKLLAGKVSVVVENVGNETISWKVKRILDEALEGTLDCQTQAQVLADKAVGPILALGAVAAGVVGFQGSLGVITCDLGTGTRLSAPLRMLAFLSLCAQKGILVSDGRALETMGKVDTILFDRSALVAGDRPKVVRVFNWGKEDEFHILQLAAVTQQRLAHPISRAIHEKLMTKRLFEPELAKRLMPEMHTPRYHAGMGITVRDHVGFGISAEIEGRLVRVGNARFMQMEGVVLPAGMEKEMKRIDRQGQALVLVAIDGALSGGIELHMDYRQEIRRVVDDLRRRDVNHLALVTGDLEEPTRDMAGMFGMDRYFAEKPSLDSAHIIQRLKAEGRRVCFVGDGVYDPLILNQADVFISLGGLSRIPVNPVPMIFIQDRLGQLCDVVDIARDLDRNFQRSWKLIVVPGALCMVGVFALGFGLWQSFLVNTAATVVSFINGMLPMRKVMDAQAEKVLEMEGMVVGHTRKEDPHKLKEAAKKLVGSLPH